MTKSVRSLRLLTATVLLNAVLPTAFAHAQTTPPTTAKKALVYCPVGIDQTGCDNVVTALTAQYPGGVDRGYDGGSGTVDLATADLQHYTVVVVPSLADDASDTPYALLRGPTIADRLRLVTTGRVAVWSGTPDQGTANRAEKDALIRNLSAWAGFEHDVTGVTGLVVLQDNSSDPAQRYGWLAQFTSTVVTADTTLTSYASVQTVTTAGSTILNNGGTQLAYANMATYGLHVDATSGSALVSALGGSTNRQAVLVTDVGGANGVAKIQPDRGVGSDYSPGENVTFTGTGWAPGETVTWVLHEDPTVDENRTFSAVADQNGNILNSQLLLEAHDIGVRYLVIATGETSGRSAQTWFTDGNVKVFSAGTGVTFTVTYRMFTASTSCSGTVNPSTASVDNAGKTLGGVGAGQSMRLDAPATADGGQPFSGWSGTGTFTLISATGGRGICAVGSSGSDSYTATYLNPPDLTINKSHSGNFTVGTNGTYTITVGNSGGTATSGTVTVTDPLPTSLTFVSASGTGWNCNAASGTVSCTRSTAIAIGANAPDITLTVSVGSGAFPSVTNTASVSGGGEPAANNTNNSDSDVTTVNGNPDLRITKSHSGNFTVGTPGSYSLTVSNQGNAATSGTVTLTDNLPTGLSYVSGTSAGNAWTCSAVSQAITCTNATSMAAGGSAATLTLTVGVAAAAAPSVTNTASVSGGGEPAGNNGNNSASDPTTVTNPATTTTLASSLNPSKFGQSVTFTATVSSAVGAPTGSVQFKIDGANAGAPVPLTGATATTATATYTTSTLSVATHPVAADYSPTGVFAASSTTAPLSQVVNKADQTITFGALANKTYGDAPVTVSATASSGLTVGFTSQTTGTCTVSGTTVTLKAAGSCTIRASQAGDGSYNAAPTVDQSFSIGKPVLTVKANDKTRTYGAVNPAFDGTITGFVNGDNATVLTTQPTYGTSATTASPAGTYDITGSGAAAANYDFTYVKGTLSIAAASLTVTADDKTKVYGQANPPFTVAYAGFVNGDDASDLGGTLAFATAADASSGVGSYDVTPSGLTATNYDITFVKGALSVTPKDLTVTAEDKSRAYNVANPTFTAAYAGFVNGDDATKLTGTLSFATSATQTSDVGTYSITPSGLTSTNYTIAFVDGTLTITKADQTITFAALTDKKYGDAPVPLSATTDADGLTVTFAVGAADQCTLTGPSVASPGGAAYAATITGAGSCAVTASQSGDKNHNAAQDVVHSFTIDKAALSVTTVDVSRLYGASNPAFTVSYAGFVLGESPAALGGALSFTTTATSASGAGTYAVTPGGLTSANYLITFNDGTLTIDKAALSVTVDAATKVYGSANPTFTLSYSGFVLGEDHTALGGTGQFTTAATASSDVGSYPVTVTGLTSGNYEITYHDGSLSVTPASLTVTANDKSRLYGGTDPTFTVSYNGFVLGQDATALSGALAFDQEATATSGVGTYKITPKGLTSTNYNITFTDGTLTIDPAPLTITTNAATKVYGSANPAFAVSYTGFVLSETSSVLAGTLGFATSAVDASDVGDYDVTPNGLTSSNYAITFVKGTLSVTKKDLTVTANDAFKVYGAPLPSFSASYAGFVLGQNEAALGGTLAFATPASVSSNVGKYSITPSGLTSGNYAIAFADGELDVTPAALSITVNNSNKVYGSANPPFSVSYAGFVLGQHDDVLGGTLAFATGATAASDVGDYDVTASGQTSSNYDITYHKGTLTITKKDLTVTAADKSRIYGDANPSLTGILSGVVNNDDITDSYSTVATQNSSVGTYPIVPALADPNHRLGNYDLTSTNGTLTITKAPLAVTAADKSKVYGDANPTLDGSITGIKNADDITASYSTAATATTEIGDYPITFTLNDPDAKLQNYDLTPTDGKLTITPAPLSVTPDDQTKVYGENNPALTGTIVGLKNGDPVTAAYSTSATASSDVGSYDITAAFVDGNSKLHNYSQTLNKGTLNITPAALSITVNNSTKVYGSANPPFAVTYSGFVLGQHEDALTGTPAFATAATAGSNVGTYDVTASGQTSTNYDITYHKGTLTITKKDLTVAADDKTRVYGDANPPLTGTLTGVVNSDNITPNYSTSATPASAVGGYAITPALADPDHRLGNYELTTTNGTLTITKAPLSATAADKSKTYGDANPTLTGTIVGIKNNDNITPVYATLADAGTAIGTYDITVTLNDPGYKLGNYTVTLNKGALTINKAPLSVTADSKTKVYGDANPLLTGTLTGVKNSDNITPSYSTPADVNSGVGTYTITPSLADPDHKLGNYNLTATTGTLSVTKAVLTITADNQTVLFGVAFPAFTVKYTGFKLGQSLATSAVTGTPSVTTTAVVGSSSYGTYPITPTTGSLASANYSFSFVNGTLSIQAWTLRGFYQPVDMTITTLVYNTVKGGSTVPLKFNIYAATNSTTSERTDVAAVKSITQTKISCQAGALEDAVEEIVTTGGTELRYTGGMFIDNWKTPAGGGVCYKVTMAAIDGSKIDAYFKMK